MGDTASHSANHRVQITEGIKSSAGQLRRRPLASASRYPAGRLGDSGPCLDGTLDVFGAL